VPHGGHHRPTTISHDTIGAPATGSCRRSGTAVPWGSVGNAMSRGRLPGTRRLGAALIACQLVAGSGACARTPEPGNPPAAGSVDTRDLGDARGGDGAAPDNDQTCLRALESQGVAYRRVTATGGMRTPVEVTGPLGKVALVARGRRSALMDCVLARALVQASDVFEELNITAMTFSAAYDHRTRRGSSELSAHAYGLAIDVHTVRGPFGEYDIRKHFEPGVGKWRGLDKDKDPQVLGACVGEPLTAEGRMLRQLACGLKLHPAFRVIVSPDDNSDHQDHLHIEARSDFYPPPPGAPPPPAPPPPAQATPEAKRPFAQHGTAKRKHPTKRRSPAKKKPKPRPKSKTQSQSQSQSKSKSKASLEIP
jgi:hypothetical protein